MCMSVCVCVCMCVCVCACVHACEYSDFHQIVSVTKYSHALVVYEAFSVKTR